MTIRTSPLFLASGKPTRILLSLWKNEGALQPLQPGVAYLERDRSARSVFRGLWHQAFPTRKYLPFGPLADSQGLAVDDFWNLLLT